MGEILTQKLLSDGWAIVGLLVVLWSFGWMTGKIVSGKNFQRERDRGDRWESAWYKLYAAVELRNASEAKAVNEMALTLSAAIAGLREATGGEHREVASPDNRPEH